MKTPNADKVLGSVLLAFVVLMLGAAIASAQEHSVVLFIDGVEVTIPEGQKLICVPDHWKEEEIYREAHRARDIGHLVATPAVEPPEEDCLVISPATTCAEMREMMGQ